MGRKIAVVALLSGLLAGFAYYYFYLETYHFAAVQDGVLYRSGMQDLRRLRNAWRRVHFKSIINLQSDADLAGKYEAQEAQERAFCTECGIQYYRIPLNEKMPPGPAEIGRLLAVAGRAENQPVLMHDSQGVIREGMMVAAWQMERMHYTPQQALERVNWFGHPPSPVVIDFIIRYHSVEATAKTPSF